MKELFLIIGAPGSGKTTDAALIAEADAAITHYSTGDLLRAEVASGSELGQKISALMNEGKLVPLEVVIKAIATAIKNSPTATVLLDGYPRSDEQMRALDELLQNEPGIILRGVLEVRVREEIARERVLGRSRGEDDNEAVFASRMQVYTEPLEGILKFYQAKKLHYIIDGERAIEPIVRDMRELIERIKGLR